MASAALLSEGALARREGALRVLLWGAAVLPLLLPLLISLAVTPSRIERGEVVLSPPCPIKRMLGRDCPSCGLTRAFTALGHGDLTAARRYHRASPFVYGIYAVGALITLSGFTRAAIRYRRLPRTPFEP